MKKISGIVLFVLLQPAWAENQPSVLLINVDDWNDWNQVLRGHPQVITPNIERLAKKYIKLVPPHAQQLVLLDEVTERDFQHDGGREAAKPIKSAAVAQ